MRYLTPHLADTAALMGNNFAAASASLSLLVPGWGALAGYTVTVLSQNGGAISITMVLSLMLQAGENWSPGAGAAAGAVFGVVVIGAVVVAAAQLQYLDRLLEQIAILHLKCRFL